MAERPKNTPDSVSRKSQARHGTERRKLIAAIVSVVLAFIVFLSILSYSTHDEAIIEKLSVLDVFRLPFSDQVKSLASELHNRLGLVGALIANFFVNSTVGYGSIVFPVLVVLWSWIIVRKKDIHRPITFTNYTIILALLFSTTLGTANLVVGSIDKAWSGIVGAFLADVATKLLGTVGASIVIVTALFVTIVLAIDLDIHKTIERTRTLWAMISNRVQRRGEYAGESVGEAPEESPVLIRKYDEDVFTEEPERGGIPNDQPEEDIPIPDEEVAVPVEETASTEVRFDVQRKQPDEQDEEETLEPPPTADDDKEIDYVFPSVELLDTPRQAETIPEDELKANAELVRTKLADFDVEIESVSVTPGPVVTLYELVPASGVKISRIVSLADDLALALAAKGIRIIAPIPGKSAVGVEIPNRNPSLVHLRSVLNSTKFREMKAALPIALGKTISGDVYTDDLAKMPHLLIAGSTGSGKSVGINTILASLLFRLHPSEVKFIIIDPKKIELTLYARLRHHFLAVSPDVEEDIITTPENAVYALRGVESEMENRYDRLAAAGVRNIADYNERWKAGRLKNTETVVHRKMPYLIVVIDELADLMITAACEVEEPIARLAQLARAVGIHLVLATQRPSVDVITGVIKANFPARIAYQVASKIDSRTILDMNGAEQLLGSGDMLYLPSVSPKPVRIQNAFISTEEVERLTDHVARQQGYSKPFQLPSILEKKRNGMRGASGLRDEFFEEAARLVVRHQQGSVSLLQRRLKVGYSRAARIIDELEAAGIVGPFDGSKARLVLIESEEQLDRLLSTLE